MTDFLHLAESHQLFNNNNNRQTSANNNNLNSKSFLSLPNASMIPRQASIDALFASMNNNTLFRLSSLASLNGENSSINNFDEELFNELNFPKHRENSFAAQLPLTTNNGNSGNNNTGNNIGDNQRSSSHDSVYSTSDSEISSSSTPRPLSPLSSTSTNTPKSQNEQISNNNYNQAYQQAFNNNNNNNNNNSNDSNTVVKSEYSNNNSNNNNNNNNNNNMKNLNIAQYFTQSILPLFDPSFNYNPNVDRQSSMNLPPVPNVENVHYSFNYNYNDNDRDGLSSEFDDSEFEFSPINSVPHSVPMTTRRLTNNHSSSNSHSNNNKQNNRMHKRSSSMEINNNTDIFHNHSNNIHSGYAPSSRATNRQQNSHHNNNEKLNHRNSSSHHCDSSMSAPNSPFHFNNPSSNISPKTLLLSLAQQQKSSSSILSPSSPLSNIIPVNTGHPSSSSDLDPNEIVVGIYTRAERAAKIARYRAKRARRQWTKKIMYNCRKSFADNRPRVGGRFIKMKNNGEINSPTNNNNDSVMVQ